MSWIHRKGFRSPTERQLIRWELDGGDYREFQLAVLVDGRIYRCRADFLKAEARVRIVQAIKVLRAMVASRLSAQYQTALSSMLGQVKSERRDHHERSAEEVHECVELRHEDNRTETSDVR